MLGSPSAYDSERKAKGKCDCHAAPLAVPLQRHSATTYGESNKLGLTERRR